MRYEKDVPRLHPRGHFDPHLQGRPTLRGRLLEHQTPQGRHGLVQWVRASEILHLGAKGRLREGGALGAGVRLGAGADVAAGRQAAARAAVRAVNL